VTTRCGTGCCTWFHRPVEDRLLPVQADAAGELATDVLGVRVAASATALRLTWDGGSAEV
jgi:hypothetical protein